MPKRIAAISMVKDEADIIELFVRINVEYVDHLFLVDNGSTDATPNILRCLQEEGLPLTVWSYPSLDYQQDIITTAVLRKVAASGAWDWIVPIDADEFLQPASGCRLATALSRLDADYVGALPWRTYVPVNDGFADRAQPLLDGFAPRQLEPRLFYKAVVPARMAAASCLAMGNHALLDAHGRPRPMKDLGGLGLRLAHVPVRSSAQIMIKTLVGSHKYSLKANRQRGEGYHWDTLARHIRRDGYRLDLQGLQRIALGYATMPGDALPGLSGTAEAIGRNDHRRRWPELARVDLAARLDAFAADLCESLRQAYLQRLPIPGSPYAKPLQPDRPNSSQAARSVQTPLLVV